MSEKLTMENKVRVEWRMRQCEDNLKQLLHAAKLEEKSGNREQAAAMRELADGVKNLISTIQLELANTEIEETK